MLIVLATKTTFQIDRKELRSMIFTALLSEIFFGVPQGSIQWHIFFKIFLSDFFLVINDVNFARYAGDNIIYDSGDGIDSVTTSLKISAKRLFQ